MLAVQALNWTENRNTRRLDASCCVKVILRPYPHIKPRLIQQEGTIYWRGSDAARGLEPSVDSGRLSPDGWVTADSCSSERQDYKNSML
jgi:hypothetical protein